MDHLHQFRLLTRFTLKLAVAVVAVTQPLNPPEAEGQAVAVVAVLVVTPILAGW
jgi:hypothetical protein